MDRGQKFYAPTGETTEWEDILVQKGIIAPKSKVEVEEEEEHSPKVTHAHKSMEDLDDDDDEYDDEGELSRIRAQRLKEMKQIASRANYGEVYPISKADWVNEVNEISQVRHCWVVAYLWDTSVNDCKLMDMLVREVAQRHRDVKFVSISADTCIENWPKRLPTLFMYANGQLRHQIHGLSTMKGSETRVEDLESALAKYGVFEKPQFPSEDDGNED